MKTIVRLLNDFNVLEVLIIGYFAFFLVDMWKWFETNHATLTLESAGVYSSLVLLIGGCLKMALTNVMDRWEKLHVNSN